MICNHSGEKGRSCDYCRASQRNYVRTKKALRRRLLAEDPTIRPHGDFATYSLWGCTCGPCRAAGTEKRYSYKKPEVPAIAKPFGREWCDG